jgi:hypothetical protein
VIGAYSGESETADVTNHGTAAMKNPDEKFPAGPRFPDRHETPNRSTTRPRCATTRSHDQIGKGAGFSPCGGADRSVPPLSLNGGGSWGCWPSAQSDKNRAAAEALCAGKARSLFQRPYDPARASSKSGVRCGGGRCALTYRSHRAASQPVA